MLYKKMRALMNEVSDEVAEREDSIECNAIALLTGKNMFKLGDTGQAKSFEINEFRKRIIGAKQFEKLLTKQTDEESLFGRLDLKSYIDGNPKMNTVGKIPDCHISFVDEIFKCNDGVLNSLLTALNERRYTNEGEVMDIPVISFFSASNEIPDFNNPEEKILRPLYDRFELKVVTRYIQSRENRQRILSRKQTGQAGRITATITLDELYSMQCEVAAVEIPVEINELMDDMLCELRSLKIHVSDRKFLNYYPLAQAKAWLRGRTIVEDTDLSVMKYYFWTVPDEIPVIEKVLDKFCLSPFQAELKKITSMATESYDVFNNGDVTNNAIVKLRGELGRVYRMIMKKKADVTEPDDEAAITRAIDDLEYMSKEAHKKANFKYVPLKLL